MSGTIEFDDHQILRGTGGEIAIRLPSGYIVEVTLLGKPCCASEDPESEWRCTRLPGHRGRHVACEFDDEAKLESGIILATWR